MQRWRFIRNVTFALVLLGAPAWLNAQEPAKKDTATNPAPAAALKTQPPAEMQPGKPQQRPWCRSVGGKSDGWSAGVPSATAKKEFEYLRISERPGLYRRRADRALGRAADRGGGAGLRRRSRQPGLWSRRGNGKDARGRRSDPSGGQSLSRPAVPSDCLAGLPADRLSSTSRPRPPGQSPGAGRPRSSWGRRSPGWSALSE